MVLNFHYTLLPTFGQRVWFSIFVWVQLNCIIRHYMQVSFSLSPFVPLRLSCSLPFLLLCPHLTVSHEVALRMNSFSLASLVSMAAWGQAGLVLSPWSIRWTSPPDCDSLKGTVVYRPLVGPARGNYTSDSLAFAISPCLGIFILSTSLKFFFLFCIVELAVSERVGF